MAACRPQALWAALGHVATRGTRWPPHSCPHRWVVMCPALRSVRVLGLGQIRGSGIPRVVVPTVSAHVPAGSAIRMMASATSTKGRWGAGVSAAPPPRLMTPWGQRAVSCPLLLTVYRETGRRHGHVYRHLEGEPALQSRVVGLMEPGPRGHTQCGSGRGGGGA